MKPDVKRILAKLTSHRVDLARKAPSVEKDFSKLNDKLKKAEAKIDSSFMAYRKEWNSFQDIIKEVEGDRKRLENDIAEIGQAAIDLGVDFNSVKGLKESQDLSRKLDGLTSDLPKLYKEPK
jgi:predicted  nucleic acid-binding Zn-ribbon protein